MTRKVLLWPAHGGKRDTDKAFLYWVIPPSRHPGKADEVWIPKSQLAGGRTKYPPDQSEGAHKLELPEWLCEEKGL